VELVELEAVVGGLLGGESSWVVVASSSNSCEVTSSPLWHVLVILVK
jgi:hypothetical protein